MAYDINKKPNLKHLKDLATRLNAELTPVKTRVKALEDMGVLDGTHKLLTMAEHGAQQAQQYPSDVPYDSPSDGPYVSAGSAVVYPEEAMHGPA